MNVSVRLVFFCLILIQPIAFSPFSFAYLFFYFFFFFSTHIIDPRTRDWPMMSSPFPTLAICLSYAYIVKVSCGQYTYVYTFNTFFLTHLRRVYLQFRILLHSSLPRCLNLYYRISISFSHSDRNR